MLDDICAAAYLLQKNIAVCSRLSSEIERSSFTTENLLWSRERKINRPLYFSTLSFSSVYHHHLRSVNCLYIRHETSLCVSKRGLVLYSQLCSAKRVWIGCWDKGWPVNTLFTDGPGWREMGWSGRFYLLVGKYPFSDISKPYLPRNSEAWAKIWNFRILKSASNSEIWAKFWNLGKILKFGRLVLTAILKLSLKLTHLFIIR